MSITLADPDQVRLSELIALGVFKRGHKDNEEYEKLKVKLKENKI